MTQLHSLAPSDLSATARYLILTAAFLGWAGSGLQMAVMTLSGRAATTSFLRTGGLDADRPLDPARLLWLQSGAVSPGQIVDEEATLKRIAAHWNAWYQAGFLLGAAAGGLAFGLLGDRVGRVKAMALSILCYSGFSGVGYWAVTPEQLLLLRFLSGMGVGGMWPTGVSLASEAWPDVSRPMLAGLLGTSANVGLVLFNAIGYFHVVVPDSWRWTMMVCAAPAVLGVFVWAAVPESQRWLAARHQKAAGREGLSIWAVFQPPLLRLTLIGIALGTIPLLGGWGATQWLVFWADKAHGVADPRAKALTAIMRSSGGAVGSLIGGWLANLLGRRITYFLVSLSSLALGEYICLALTPKDYAFSAFVFALGFISTIFFGWLPLYLPELFPTHARATGSGVSFNFGRILSAVGVLAAGGITTWLNEDYGRAGSITMLVYALGMIVILFAPDTTKSKLKD
jgi:MFS family permease